MAKFRLDSIANLARQLEFTPHDTRAVQIAAAEILLHDLDSEKAYPIDFVYYRITGYQPRTTQPDGHADLLTGLALQHDLGLLIEQVSEGLNLQAADASEPVLCIDDVTERFNVTSKTIQRWRRKGLPARRFTFGDGKRRVGFLLSSVERFIAAHRNQLGSTTLCTAVADDEQTAIIRHARRLAVDCGCCVNEICLRIGRKFHRSPMTVLHTLRKHDAEHAASSILPRAAEPLSDEQASRIAVAAKRGMGVSALARKLRRSRSMVYRSIVQARVARLNKRKIRFIEDPLYRQSDAAAVIADIVSQEEIGLKQAQAEMRVPRDLPPYLRDLYRTPLLSPARERALFLKFNFHKFQFATARRKLEPEFARARDLNRLEQHLRDITNTRNAILQANLRLVVSVARRHVRPGVSLMELISEGNIILLRAVEGFDIHKGNRFSTYATLALMKGFAQAVPMMLASHRGSTDTEILSAVPDGRSQSTLEQRIDRDQIAHLLGRLDDREREVLRAHYGLGSDISATYEQVGAKMGLSKQRVRQIEQAALAKLRT
jgi:RNA polymerase sigma factor (sigma-70 family)